MTNRLASFAILLMLTISLAGPVSAQVSTLTPDLLSKLLALVASKGADTEVPAVLASPLGFSAKGQNWMTNSVAIQHPPTVHHAFSVGRGSDQDISFSQRGPDTLRVFRSHRDGKIVAGLIYNLQTAQITMLANAEAQKELDAEFAEWDWQFTNAK